MSLAEFVARTLQLIEKERDAEIRETRTLTAQLSSKELQRRGICLLKLRLQERCAGLYGRTVATFQPFWPGTDLPAHKLTPGDIVGVGLMKDGVQSSESLLSGIVSRVLSTSIQLAFDEIDEVFSLDDDVQYRLTKLANDVTYRRMKRALKDLNQYSAGPALGLINVCFGSSPLAPPSVIQDMQWVNTNLDTSQQEAVHFALARPDIAIVHGPPGTGKTTTVVEIILQAVRQGSKVLAVAPSNVAVDNLVERLAVHHKRIVRIGHPARLLPHTQPFALDALVAAHDQTSLAADARNDLNKKMSQLQGSRGRARAEVRVEMKQLRREVRQREEAATRSILVRADVVLVTLTSAAPDSTLRLLDENHFHLVVIDECSQSLEAACWIGLLHGVRCVLAGDPNQLPPTILSQDAEAEGLGKTLMDRVISTYGDRAVRMLTVQYRMHQDIMHWASQQLYSGRLQAHPSVARHLLRDLPGVEDCAETATPLLLIDTSGCHMPELELQQEVSKGNEGEADIVAAHVKQLISAGVSPEDIAVITPYNLQVELLRQRLSSEHRGLEVNSVDGFQGREKEAVIISLVRSNSRREVGFLAEKRRINVAVTRARRHLAVVCDSETIGADDFLKSLLDYMSSTGQVWSAQEFIQDGRVGQYASRPPMLENLMSGDARHDQQRDGTHQRKKKTVKTRRVNTDTEARAAEPAATPQTREPGSPLVSTEDKMEMYEHVLEKFATDAEQSMLTFPSMLTSHDRMVIHEVSEKLGLRHFSSGKDKARYIVVSKPATSLLPLAPTTGEDIIRTVAGNEESLASVSSTTIPSSHRISGELHLAAALAKEAEALSVSSESGLVHGEYSRVTCRLCHRTLPKTNLAMHEAQCVLHSGRGGQPATSATASHTDKKGKKKQKQGAAGQLQQTATALQNVADDDFDTLIATVTELDSKCSVKKCKTLTNTLGRNCVHCGRRFCLQHLLPEVHGCGNAARTLARQTIVREGVLYQGSGVPNKHLNPERRAQLQNKLNIKLDAMAGQRTKKDAKKSDSK